jgi:hypothetical protein
MVLMDHCTRRIVGFAVQAGVLDGPSVCRMLLKEYYNRERAHTSLDGMTPAAKAENPARRRLDLAQSISLAISVPRALSAADSGLKRNSPQTPAR